MLKRDVSCRKSLTLSPNFAHVSPAPICMLVSHAWTSHKKTKKSLNPLVTALDAKDCKKASSQFRHLKLQRTTGETMLFYDACVSWNPRRHFSTLKDRPYQPYLASRPAHPCDILPLARAHPMMFCIYTNTYMFIHIYHTYLSYVFRKS